jgi:hypothetical protein
LYILGPKSGPFAFFGKRLDRFMQPSLLVRSGIGTA